MGMVMEYVRLRPAELAELHRLLLERPRDAHGYVTDQVLSRGTDLDKAWDGLDYLLTKVKAPVDVIAGGEPITDDTWSYDSPRLLGVAEVAKASRFLDATSFAALAKHYRPRKMMKADVYPEIWDEDWALSYLEEHYASLVSLFHAAAADGEPILIRMA
jgi:hypothetical protein